MGNPTNFGETLTELVKKEFADKVFVNPSGELYTVTGWAGSKTILQLLVTYQDGTVKAIGAGSHKDRLATPDESKRYKEFHLDRSVERADRYYATKHP